MGITIFGYEATEINLLKERISNLEKQIETILGNNNKSDLRKSIGEAINDIMTYPSESRFTKNPLYNHINNLSTEITTNLTKHEIEKYISQEEFIDKIIDRIKRKQL